MSKQAGNIKVSARKVTSTQVDARFENRMNQEVAQAERIVERNRRALQQMQERKKQAELDEIEKAMQAEIEQHMNELELDFYYPDEPLPTKVLT